MTEKLTWHNETRKLRDLVPWERNPRQTQKEEARRLQESREEFDQPHVFLIGPDDELYDGHQRLDTWAQRWGLDLEVDVRVASRPLTEKEREKLTVYLHTGAHGDWDWETLASWDVGDLMDWGFDADTLAQWNDNAANLALMLEAEEEEPLEDPGPQIDKAEELREKWGVESGQLWQLGDHRLICGDCTDAAVVERVMGGERAAMAVTDPPYGVTDAEWDRPFVQIDLDVLLENTVGLVACFNAARPERLLGVLSLIPMPERVGVWRYSSITPKSGMIWSWQPVFYWRCGQVVAWDSLDWFQGEADKTGLHPTQKPVEFFEKIIKVGDTGTVFDPFVGSGTALVACERLGRPCRAIDIDVGSVAVTLERWAQMTGRVPVLVQD